MLKKIINDEQVTAKEIAGLICDVEDTLQNEIFYSSVRSQKKEKEAIKHSTFITMRNLEDKDTIVGLVRIIGDSTYEYYISEVMVAPEYQNQGIGTKLMNTALDYCKDNGFMKIFLTAAHGREPYYRRFGFKDTKYSVMRILNETKREK